MEAAIMPAKEKTYVIEALYDGFPTPAQRRFELGKVLFGEITHSQANELQTLNKNYWRMQTSYQSN